MARAEAPPAMRLPAERGSFVGVRAELAEVVGSRQLPWHPLPDQPWRVPAAHPARSSDS